MLEGTSLCVVTPPRPQCEKLGQSHRFDRLVRPDDIVPALWFCGCLADLLFQIVACVAQCVVVELPLVGHEAAPVFGALEGVLDERLHNEPRRRGFPLGLVGVVRDLTGVPFDCCSGVW
jgi:hypothetical protein